MKRTVIGISLILIAITGLILATANRKVLWAGIKEVKVEEKVYVPPKLSVPQGNPFHTRGPVEVMYQWQAAKNEFSPSGQYQFRDINNNEVQIITFCEPTPIFEQGNIIEFTYIDSKEESKCKIFSAGKILKGNK